MIANARRQSERGSVLVLALLVSLIILGLGLTVMWVASSGQKISANVTRRQEALYAAEGGVEKARAVLYANRDWTAMLKGCAGATRNDSLLGMVLCDPAVALENVQLVPATSMTQTEVSKLPGGSAQKNMRYTLWIRNDWASEGCVRYKHPDQSKYWDCSLGDGASADCEGENCGGDASKLKDKNGRVVVRSEGIARDGLSVVSVEVIITKPGSEGTGMRYTGAGGGPQGNNAVTAGIQ